MSQVIQAKCPHCQNVLRIPADWLAKAMRCKYCKNTFQAKAKSSAPATSNASVSAGKANIPVAKPAHAITAQPAIAQPAVAKPANAVQAAPALAAPARPASSDPLAFPAGDESADATPSIAKPRKKGRGMLLLVLVFLFLFALGATGAGIVVYKAMNTHPGKTEPQPVAKVVERGPSKTPPLRSKNPEKSEPENPKGKIVPIKEKGAEKPAPMDDPKKDPPKKTFVPKKKDLAKKEGAKPSPSPFSNDPFPRRALLISVNNYLMFSTVHYGSGQDSVKGGYPGSSTAVVRERLTRPPMNFPSSQVIELSDGIPLDSRTAKAHPTQKSVVETTIKDFVDTSREQDRILILFAGHAASVEDKSYLIPIDGKLTDTESLIPLKWVYDQLAKCRAQQKVLVLDVFRFSPGRGFELPSAGEGDEGTMPEAFDKDLQNPPAGIQVWCSCQKEQNSVELEGGSAFMQALCHSLQGSTEMTGISGPTQPIPVDTLVVKVNQRLKDLLAAEKRTQLSRLTGKEPETTTAYNPKEPLPPALTLKAPTAAGGDAAGYAQIDNILEELKVLPPVRDTRAGDINLLNARNLPAFPVKTIDGYKRDGYQAVNELMTRYKAGSEAYAKEFPLRAAIFDAVEALQASRKLTMREVLPGPINPKSKQAFLLEQGAPAESIFKLEQALAQMKEAGEKREAETSKRWQANFDYTQARLQSRIVYLFEYSFMLGRIRADDIPDLAPGQSGWRLGTGKKIAVTESKAKAYAKDTAKLWKRIQQEYPETPWALLAQRESMITLGLQWRPKSD